MNRPETNGGASPQNQASIRRGVRKFTPFAQIPNALLSDPRLSWKAKGVLSYLLSKPDGWKVRVSDISNHGPDKRDAVRSALKELRKVGYAKLECIRQNGKVIAWEWLFSDYAAYSPETDFPLLENPDLENPPYSKTEGKKTGLEKDRKTKESPKGFGAEDFDFSAYDQTSKAYKEAKARILASLPHRFAGFTEEGVLAFCEEHQLDELTCGKIDPFEKLMATKGYTWDAKNYRFKPIRWWGSFLIGLNDKIANAFQ